MDPRSPFIDRQPIINHRSPNRSIGRTKTRARWVYPSRAPAGRQRDLRPAFWLRNRRPHVYLDLGGRQRAVVDPHVVDPALEVLAPDCIATDAQVAGRDCRCPAHAELPHEDTVYV